MLEGNADRRVYDFLRGVGQDVGLVLTTTCHEILGMAWASRYMDDL